MSQEEQTPKTELPKTVDVLGYVEATIRGIFILTGRLLRTPVGFVLTPDRLWVEMYRDDQRALTTSTRYSAPLTFLVVSLALYLGALNITLAREPFGSHVKK